MVKWSQWLSFVYLCFSFHFSWSSASDRDRIRQSALSMTNIDFWSATKPQALWTLSLLTCHLVNVSSVISETDQYYCWPAWLQLAAIQAKANKEIRLKTNFFRSFFLRCYNKTTCFVYINRFYWSFISFFSTNGRLSKSWTFVKLLEFCDFILKLFLS